MIKIDGTTYNIPVVSMRRRADFLDKYAERTEDGVLHRELIGVYYNYQIELGSTVDTSEYQLLWNKLTEPTEFHTVEVPDVGGNLSFTAYFSNVTDEVRRMVGSQAYFKHLTVNFIAKSPTRS